MEQSAEVNMLNLLKEEYPVFRNAEVRINKRFTTAEKKNSNAFLVTSDVPKLERFVVKGFPVYQERGLEIEWQALWIAQKYLATPKLLMPEHKPAELLLLSYILGVSAQEALENGRSEEEVILAIGHETGKLHKVPFTHFGKLFIDEHLSWKEYLMQKIPERIQGMTEIVHPDLVQGSVELFNSLTDVIEDENNESPVLIHRDIYLNNFLITERNSDAVLIDYGMAFGGRPLYDLAKFFIHDIYFNPKRRDMFLQAYTKHISLPDNFADVMKLYLLKEAAGSVKFFHSIEQTHTKDHMIQILRELIAGHGRIIDLITLY